MSYTLGVLTESDYANGIPEQWIPLLKFDAFTKSATQKFEGPENSMSAFLRQDDPMKKPGDVFHFQTLANLHGKGRGQTEQLKGYEEKLSMGSYDLTVSQTRHGVAYKSTLKIQSLYDPGEWARPQLGKWYATRIDNDAFTQFVTTDVDKVIYAGNATSAETLKKGTSTINSLTIASLRKANAVLESMGADPIEVVRKSGEAFPIYGAFITPYDKWNLMNDPSWEKYNELAEVRGEENPIFTGAFGKLGSMMLYVVPTLRGWGNPLRPEAKIYGAHNNSVTTIVVGSDTTGIIDYTEFFPSSGTLSILGENGAIEYVTYTGKTTYSFTGCTRGATYGDVASTKAAYTGGATNNEFVTLGHTESRVVCFGAQCMMRAFAQTMTQVEQKEDYGQEVGIGISFMRGHKAVKDSSGRNKGYVVMKCNSYPFDAAI